MKISIAAIGILKEKSLERLFTKYISSLPWKVSLHEKKPFINKNKSIRISQEEIFLFEKLKNCEALIVLDEDGEQFTSKEFSEKICNWEKDIENIGFAIGGPDGVSKALKEKATVLLSFGDMTWPHLLARIMLAEQLYRSSAIITNHPYHRG